MIGGNGKGSTVAAVWCQLTVEEDEAGLVSTGVLAVRDCRSRGSWWLCVIW